MKSTRALLASVFTALSFALSLGGCAADATDAGEEPPPQNVVDETETSDEAAVNPHTDKVILQGALAPGQSYDDDYVAGRFVTYAVTVAAGERLRLTVTPGDETTSSVFLYGPDLRRGLAGLRRVASAQGTAANGGARIDQSLATAGTYLVVVGEARGQRGRFTVARDEGGTALSLVPARATRVESAPNTVAGRADSPSQFDRYLCDSARAHPGPESVYEIDVESEGFLALELEGPNAGALDVYLLRSLHGTACLDGGVTRAGAWVTPGRYYAVVDSTTATPRAFSLKVAVTTPANLEDYGMDVDVARLGLRAFDVAFRRRDGRRFLYGMVNFGLHSSRKREWIFDLSTGELEANLYVAHGQASRSPENRGMATRFSNIPQSNQSSLGMTRTGVTYEGSFGYSIRLHGLEAGYNDKLLARSVVIHPWFGSTETFVRTQRYTAETWGCPALDQELPREFYDRIANGMLLWFYAPDGDWSENSKYLR